MWGEGTSYKYAAGRQEALSTAPWTACQWLRDGPLENLWGEASEVQKKHSRKGKLSEKNSYTPINPKKYSCYGLKKNSYKEFDNEKKFLRLENSPPPQ